MNLVTWLIVGGVIGWLANMLLWSNERQGLIVNVFVGMVGAIAGGWLLSPLLGAGTLSPEHFSLPALLVSFFGAAILLAFVDLFRHDDAR
ncbi:GlsB/YeaQ/YmgE family stress response membrane protein [Hydrogenophaga intermedia]|uniref:Putative transglycosylase associated protein n=1 Tax=Hydrogenophaga intermedia TaxID=65786 RepID=A0A1L1P8N6_HYDIT|nr:GlsB/YeaQ/YmgE family stress response membrane protein [Hydrogenophaga intermedia]TMU74840.1 GlsB/YeaQ/YmgE family stress response membrane protein [Hydrogenophaga intermedia]CDN86132.1 putative transglycosylase associated protein [Hydrogenophaga intermedia]